MAKKDKRMKCCTNPDCERCQSHYAYSPEDKYCSLCTAELVFVCIDCYKKIQDQGPEHIRCVPCEAKREDRKHNRDKALRHATDDVVNWTRKAADDTKKTFEDTKEKIKVRSEELKEKRKK